jgi:hypothetical protein
MTAPGLPTDRARLYPPGRPLAMIALDRPSRRDARLRVGGRCSSKLMSGAPARTVRQSSGRSGLVDLVAVQERPNQASVWHVCGTARVCGLALPTCHLLILWPGDSSAHCPRVTVPDCGCSSGRTHSTGFLSVVMGRPSRPVQRWLRARAMFQACRPVSIAGYALGSSRGNNRESARRQRIWPDECGKPR